MAAIPPSGAKWPLIDASPDNSPAIYGWEYHNSNFKVPPGWAEQLWPSARILRTSSRVQLLDRRNRSAAVPGCGCRRRLAAKFDHRARRPANPPAGRRRYAVHGEDLSSLAGLGTLPNREPSHEWLRYCQKGGRCGGPCRRPALCSGCRRGR
jgi:hypothetical protein